MREADFQQQVVDLAGAYGFTLVYHTFDSRHSAKGFPDLTLAKEPPRAPRIIYAELKVGRRQVTEDQQRWIAALHAAGHEVYVWRPDDFDVIVDILKWTDPVPAAVQPSPGAGPLTGGGRDTGRAADEALRSGDEARRARGGAS